MADYSDTHCHLNLNSFKDDLPAVIERARLVGISRILVPGIDIESSRNALAISQNYPEVFAAVGIHPNEALTWNKNTLQELRELASHPRVVSIGEIGLDFYREYSPPDLQVEILKAQLGLAADLGKPVILHSRSSLEQLWEILEAWHSMLVNSRSPLGKLPGILHSYEGSVQAAMKAAEHGFFIGISGPVTFKNAIERQEVASQLPFKALVFETDAPYLSPHPFRGRRNEPAFILATVEKVAALHQVTIDEALMITNKNSDTIFRWRNPA